MPPDDQNTPPNTPTPDSSPTTPSDAPETAPGAPEAPQGDFGAESNNSAINKGDAEISQPENEPKSSENQDSHSAESESVEADKPTAQIPANEPLENKSKSSLARQLLITARNAIQFRKRKKLDRVMSLFLKQSKITNDEVEKFLHVSDATTTRYLSQLEKEGKIKQTGKTGHSVFYSKI
jgi:predicted HTH transcriptional regulator